MEAMVCQSYNMGSSSGSDIYRLFNPTTLDDRLIGDSINGLVSSGGLGMASPDSLVLDDEKGELVKSPAGAKKGKKVSEAKALAALKNHSEAERRRRERINGHLATLRGLVPSTAKMDKATLLAEVISQVKELKKNAMEASKGFLIPMETDEVKVEPYEYDDEAGHGSMAYRASVCCDYRPQLLSDLRQTFDALQLQLVRAELSTLGDRVKNEFVYSCCYKGGMIDIEACQILASNVHRALSSVLDKDSTSLEYSLRTPNQPSKRRRLCFVDTSNALCNHECCSC